MIIILVIIVMGWLGSVAVKCWTCNREVAGSTPGRRTVDVVGSVAVKCWTCNREVACESVCE